VDRRITEWMADHGLTVLRLALGVVFFWFGVLKLFPGASPAEDLAAGTIEALTLGVVQPAVRFRFWPSGRWSSGSACSSIAGCG